MVTELFLAALLPLITGIIDLFSFEGTWLDQTQMDDWGQNIGDIFGSVFKWNAWFPITHMMTVLAALVGLRMALFGYRMLRHLWDALPFT